MDKQEIVNKLATRRNFHEYVEVCLHEGLSIDKMEFCPNINVYHDDTYYLHKETGNYRDVSCNFISINLCNKVDRLTQFEVDGELLTGPENFFKHYNKITKFIIYYEGTVTTPGSEITLAVIPSICNEQHWYRNEKDDVNGHFEISYYCHSLHKPALSKVVSNEIVDERYYIDGTRVEHEIFVKESREHKLSRVLGVDLKTERLEKEKLEKEKLEKERLKKLEKEKKESNWSYITIIDNEDCSYKYPLLA